MHILNNELHFDSLEFAFIIRDLVGGKTSQLETKPALEDDPQRRKPDITRARKELNWEPRIPLKIGLQKTIDYFRKELDRSNHSNRNIFIPRRFRSSSSTTPPSIPIRQKQHNDANVPNENT